MTREGEKKRLLGLHPTVRWTAAAAGPRDINEIWDWRKTQMVADAGFGVHHFKCYGLAAGHFIVLEHWLIVLSYQYDQCSISDLPTPHYKPKPL